MRNCLPKNMWEYETGIVNLDSCSGRGTHWICYKRLKDIVYYFDSLGNFAPPKELQHYFRTAKNVLYNYDRVQNDDSPICGALCLEFLATDVSQL